MLPNIESTEIFLQSWAELAGNVTDEDPSLRVTYSTYLPTHMLGRSL